jgi:FAD dependent oxidoreductase TIGR03364
VRQLAPAVRQDGLVLALWSPDEVCVDPREVVAGLPGWLRRQHGVTCCFNHPVTNVHPGALVSSRGVIEAGRVWICSGDEFRVLFPEALEQSGMIRCKLQMMRSQAYGTDWSIGPMLAAGLTLRHYATFANCPGLAALRDRVARETPWFDRYGIHVLVSQNGLGELCLGDSHEYGADIEPFDKADVEALILEYLAGFLEAPGLRIASRWHGTYAKHPDKPYVSIEPMPGVMAVTGVGGAGMTLSFGLAEAVVDGVLGAEVPG